MQENSPEDEAAPRLGCAMLHEPKLLFLDEQTAGIDPLRAASLLGSPFSNFPRKGITFFSHALHGRSRTLQPCCFIYYGKLIADGTPNSLRELPKSSRGHDARRNHTPESHPRFALRSRTPRHSQRDNFWPVDSRAH